jgi:3'-5' exoribonuclease
MKSPYIGDLQPNQQVNGVFLVQSKEVRQKKSGEPYLSLQFSDRTGDLEGKMWDNVAETMDTFDRDDFVQVKGVTQIYQNRLQITVHRIQPADEREIDYADFFPASARNPDEMFAELLEIIAGMKDPDFRALLQTVFADEEIARKYKTAPAAKSIHHAWLGGLIEHNLSLCRLAKFAAAHYADIDEDLLLAGVILHDIGKIYELSYERGFSYTDDGQLLGHIYLALSMLGDQFQKLPNFPPAKRKLLEHMILSHHGELEFGSPKIPLFPEALLLHHLDNLDSKMECMRATIAKDNYVEGNWTAYNGALDRSVLKKKRYLNAKWESKSAPAQQPTVSRRAAPVQNSIFADKLQQALLKK